MFVICDEDDLMVICLIDLIMIIVIMKLSVISAEQYSLALGALFNTPAP